MTEHLADHEPWHADPLAGDRGGGGAAEVMRRGVGEGLRAIGVLGRRRQLPAWAASGFMTLSAQPASSNGSDRAPLVGVAGLLACDKMGERSTAAVKASAILKRAGMTWGGGAASSGEPTTGMSASSDTLPRVARSLAYGPPWSRARCCDSTLRASLSSSDRSFG